MIIKTVYHFVDSNLGVETSSKKEGLTEKEGEVLEVILTGRGSNDLSSVRKGSPGGPRVGGNHTD